MFQNILIFFDFIKKLYRSRYMIGMLALRELKTTYIGSLFGFLWAVFNPVFLVAVYGIVFGIFFKSTPDPAYGTDSFLLFLLCGIVPWQFFSQSVSSSTNVILSNRNLIKKAAGFPSEILPVTTVLSNIIGHLIGVSLLLVLIMVFGGGLSPALALIFVYMFFISVFAVGLGWILSSANVFLRDIQQAVGLLLMGWFFLTPVIYSGSMVPGPFSVVLKLNPMYHMVEGYRFALLAGKALPAMDFLYMAAVSVVTFGIGGVFFRKLKPWFAEVL